MGVCRLPIGDTASQNNTSRFAAAIANLRYGAGGAGGEVVERACCELQWRITEAAEDAVQREEWIRAEKILSRE